MDNSVLHSIVEITRQRDLDGLENSLVTALADATSATSIKLLKFPIVESNTFLDVVIHLLIVTDECDRQHYQLSDEPATVAIDEKISACLLEARIRAEVLPDGKHSTFVPIVCNEKSNGLICIESAHPLEEQLINIEAIVEVFNNYQTLMDECERDMLTDLLNRRAFDTKLDRLLRSQLHIKKTMVDAGDFDEKRYLGPDSSAWLVILDIDHFKLVNDTFGHLFGDEVILTFSQKMREYFRNSDLLFRFGGEEFLAILEPTPAEMAHVTLERFRRQIANHKFPQLGRITVSIGYALVTEHDYPAQILDHADQALYYAKNNGRNRVCEYSTLVRTGKISAEETSGSIVLF